MTKHFERELEWIKRELLELSALVEESVVKAIQSLRNRDEARDDAPEDLLAVGGRLERETLDREAPNLDPLELDAPEWDDDRLLDGPREPE